MVYFDSSACPPAVGVAFFAYLLLVDHMEQSYLPLVIRSAPPPLHKTNLIGVWWMCAHRKDYMLHIVLTHVKVLLQRYVQSTFRYLSVSVCCLFRPEARVMLKGLVSPGDQIRCVRCSLHPCDPLHPPPQCRLC